MRDDDGAPMLEYRSAELPAGRVGAGDMAFAIGRRLLFAAGVGLVSGGVGSALTSLSHTYDTQLMMGWGGALIGLCVPLGRPGQLERE
jgi:hypothetical protein